MAKASNEELEEIEKLIVSELDKLPSPEKGRYEGLTLDDHRKLGLVAVLAYHCKRCNYLWLPKDYEITEENITQIPLPKSCARCKSKYWKKEPKRKINHRFGASIAALRAYHRKRKEI